MSAIRFKGVRNPLPVSQDTIIDHMGPRYHLASGGLSAFRQLISGQDRPAVWSFQRLRTNGEAGLTRTLVRAGALAGLTGGAVMAMLSMVLMWLTGGGFWAPLNLIAHTFWRSAPLNGTFSAAALIIGLAIHMMMAAFFGLVIVLVARHLPGVRSIVVAVGLLLVGAVWPAMQYGLWRAIDPVAARDFTPWVLAIGHLMFGILAATIAAIGVPAAETAPRHRR